MCVVCACVCGVCMGEWVPQQHCIHMHHRAAMNRFDELLKQVTVHHLEEMEQSSYLCWMQQCGLILGGRPTVCFGLPPSLNVPA